MLLFSFTFSLFTLKLEAEKLATCQSYDVILTSVVTSQGVVNILQLATDWLKLIVKGPRYRLHVILAIVISKLLISPFSHGNYQGKSLLGLVNTPRRG